MPKILISLLNVSGFDNVTLHGVPLSSCRKTKAAPRNHQPVPHEASTPTPERKKTTKPNMTSLDELYGTPFQYHQFKCYNFYLA